jgi:hypothetical protein
MVSSLPGPSLLDLAVVAEQRHRADQGDHAGRGRGDQALAGQESLEVHVVFSRSCCGHRRER